MQSLERLFNLASLVPHQYCRILCIIWPPSAPLVGKTHPKRVVFLSNNNKQRNRAHSRRTQEACRGSRGQDQGRFLVTVFSTERPEGPKLERLQDTLYSMGFRLQDPHLLLDVVSVIPTSSRSEEQKPSLPPPPAESEVSSIKLTFRRTWSSIKVEQDRTTH